MLWPPVANVMGGPATLVRTFTGVTTVGLPPEPDTTYAITLAIRPPFQEGRLPCRKQPSLNRIPPKMFLESTGSRLDRIVLTLLRNRTVYIQARPPSISLAQCQPPVARRRAAGVRMGMRGARRAAASMIVGQDGSASGHSTGMLTRGLHVS